MKQEQYQFTYESYSGIEELQPDDADLLRQARIMTGNAYAPYSQFQVGAVARLINGAIVAGTNQENASYPVGICAERVLLGNAATLHPGISIHTIAISYNNLEGESDHPISPCGMCRQAMLEYETRTSSPIRIILSGQEGEVYIVKTVENLLPFAFNSNELS